MSQSVTSRFSISSSRHNADLLKRQFPWQVVEKSAVPGEGFEIVAFDLGVGRHERVDEHLNAAKVALLAAEPQLVALAPECKYALWVSYQFPMQDGAINIGKSVSAMLGILQVELIFHLAPHSK